VKHDYGENITFHGDFSIHLRSHFRELIDIREVKKGANNVELYFEFDNLEKLETKLNKEGVQFVHKTREQPWRQKVMRFQPLPICPEILYGNQSPGTKGSEF
jgi:hypothetical protein